MSASGINRLRFDGDSSIFFGEKNPPYQALISFRNTFGDSENVMFTFSPHHGDVFSRNALRLAHELTEAADRIPYAIRVYSLARHHHIRVDQEEVHVTEWVPEPDHLTDDDRDRIRRESLAEPMLIHQLISEQGDAAIVFVRLNLPAGDPEAVPAVAESVRAIRDTFRDAYPDIEIHATGSVLFDEAFLNAGHRDLRHLFPAMFLVIFILLGVTLKSAAAVGVVFVVMAVSVLTALGLTGWLGIPLTIVSAGAPGLIVMLAVADCIHVISTLLRRMRGGATRHAALIHSMRVNVRPVFLTSATTALGFLSLNASDSPPYRAFGNTIALGVATAFLFSVFLLPALIAYVPIREKRTAPNRGSFVLHRIANGTIRHERALRIVLTALALVSGLGLLRLELDTDIHELYSPHLEIRQATDFHLARMKSFTILVYPMDSGSPGGVAEPSFLLALDRFSQWLRTQPGIMNVSSIADRMKRMHRALYEDEPDEERIPDRRDVAAQLLMFYELSLPAGHRLDNELDPTGQMAAVQVLGKRMSAREVRRLDAAAQLWLKNHLPDQRHTAAAGAALVWAHLVYRSTTLMALSSLAALVLISLLMIPALGRVRLGLVSLIPNIFPAVMAFGFWGLTAERIGLPAAAIAGMTIGIVVDDTIHVLSRYARARHVRGMTPEDAIRHALEHVGPAIVITSVALIAGFSILALSPFGMTAVMGKMCALIIFLALGMDLLLLPPLLLKLERMRTRADVR